MSRRVQLERLLREFRPDDRTEAAFRGSMVALLRSPGDPFARSRFAPGHVTASAFVLSPDAGSVLLLFHERLSRWLQPGGHVDPGDPDVRAASLREAGEETGCRGLEPLVDGIFDLDVHPIPPHAPEPRHLHHDVRFLFRARTTAVRAGAGVRSPSWVPLDRLEAALPDPSMRRVRRKLAAAAGRAGPTGHPTPRFRGKEAR